MMADQSSLSCAAAEAFQEKFEKPRFSSVKHEQQQAAVGILMKN